MIVAIANQSGGAGKTVVANCLALLRARSGRRVILIDTDPCQASRRWSQERGAAGGEPRLAARALSGRGLASELERLRLHYNDIVIDTEGRDTAESRAALSVARRVVVPVTAVQVDLASQYRLIARLNAARMFNPGLNVLFVLVGAAAAPDPAALAAVRAYAARVMSATLADTMIHWHGACAGDGELVAAADMQALYREVYAG